MAASMPISRALFNISAVLMIIGWLLSGHWRKKIAIISNNWLALTSISLFGICGLSLTWAHPLGTDNWDALRGYTRLLYIPVIITLVTTPEWSKRCWNTLILGMLLTLSLYILDIWFEIPGTGTYGTYSAGQGIFYHHIAQGMVLSFMGAYALDRALQSDKKSGTRAMWLSIALAALAGLLTVGQSRTAQVTVVSAYLIVFLSHASRQAKLYGFIITLATVGLLISNSPRTQERLLQGIHEVITYQHDGEHTSMGARLLAWEFSFELIKQAPWLGHGIGSYKEKAYQHFKNSPICNLGVCEQPHNQFFAITVEAGALGLLAMFVWLISNFAQQAQNIKSEHTTTLSSLFVIFFITSLFDSSLKIQAQSFFFITTLSLIASQKICDQSSATPSLEQIASN